MSLPKPEKKLLDEKKFVANAKKVLKSLNEEREFQLEEKIKSGDNISLQIS